MESRIAPPSWTWIFRIADITFAEFPFHALGRIGQERGPRLLRAPAPLHTLPRKVEHLWGDLHIMTEAGAAVVTESGHHDLAFPERFRPWSRYHVHSERL